MSPIGTLGSQINTTTAYSFVIDRGFDSNPQPNPISPVPISANSNITITFPTEYTVNSGFTCGAVVFFNGSNNVTCANPSCSNTGNTLLIQNCILAQTVVQQAYITINNVLNPSPAKTTGTFWATIGVDKTSLVTDTSNQVTLTAGQMIC